VKFPFEPRSTKSLEPGHYWCISLRTGRFAAGVVVAHARRLAKRDTRLLCIGLLNWVGDKPPTPPALSSVDLLEYAFTHVRSIQQNGRFILGKVEPRWGVEQELDFGQLAGSVVPGWGLSFIHHRAEILWGDAAWVKAEISALCAGARGSTRVIAA